MQKQWNALREIIRNNTPESLPDFVTNPFFRRLCTVMTDQGAGRADLAVAVKDALASAAAFELEGLQLRVRPGRFDERSLLKAGVEITHDNCLILTKEFSSNEKDVFRLSHRRIIKYPKMDASLAMRLGADPNATYQGMGQQAAVRAALLAAPGATVIVNLPTGCGKTLVIHALSLFSRQLGTTIVIVPTVALAIEQAERAAEVMLKAGCSHGGPYALVGGQLKEERQKVIARMRDGSQRIVFCSPEMFTGGLKHVLYQMVESDVLDNIVIDEAHVIDQWGADFRPSFQLIAANINSLRLINRPVFKLIMLSATLSQRTLDLLRETFSGGEEVVVVHAGFLRPEIMSEVISAKSAEDKISKVIDKVWSLPRPLIIYVSTRSDADQWSVTLGEAGWKRHAVFTGETEYFERRRIIDDWRRNSLDIIIATSAFGVGMDKADVPSIIHATVPESIDRYYQESGRGGRNGCASWSFIIYKDDDFNTAKVLSTETLIGPELGFTRWEAMYHSARKSGGRLIVSLDAMHYGIQFKGEMNRKWNIRTLLLMQRAGLVRLYSVMNEEDVAAIGGETSAFEEVDSTRYIGVELLSSLHRESSEWSEVEKKRAGELKYRARLFAELKEWVIERGKLCSVLKSTYTLDSIVPEECCGGCPGCRRQGLPSFTPTVGVRSKIVGRLFQTTPSWMQDSREIKVRLAISDFPSWSLRSVMNDMKGWMGRVVGRQIRVVKASPEVFAVVRKSSLFRECPFWCSLELADEIVSSDMVEIVLALDVSEEIQTQYFDDPPRVFLGREEIPSKESKYRSWWEADSRVITYETFRRMVN